MNLKYFLPSLISLIFLPIISFSQCACCGSQYRVFDFWVGEWEVYNPTGQKVGHNNILFLQDSCILQENWTSSGGEFTGTSYNFYDQIEDLWHQTWIDNQGGYLLLTGNWDGKKMVLKSDPVTDGKGKTIINRISWSPMADGSVRQHWETSTDNGKTWKTAFDGVYQKK